MIAVEIKCAVHLLGDNVATSLFPKIRKEAERLSNHVFEFFTSCPLASICA